MLGKFFFIFLKFVRSSKIITLFLWKIKIDIYLHDTFWDLTTLVIKKELKQIQKKNRYLDMGCGQFAILGQFFKMNNKNAEVLSVDIYDKFVENSINNSILNKNKIEIKKSNLFSNVNDKFDLITFNPPYVPLTKKDKEIEFPNIRYSESEGIKTTKDFLINAKKFLTTEGEILLGINTFYVPKSICIKLITDLEYSIEKITKMNFNTSIVFRIKVI